MRIGYETNGANFEYEMQDAFEAWLVKKNVQYQREITTKEVSRRADFLLIENNRLINVEAKCNQLENVIAQSRDHSIYCDYCFILISDIGVITKDNIKQIQQYGVGIIVYNFRSKAITEVFPAFYNKGRNGKIRKKYMQLITNSATCKNGS